MPGRIENKMSRAIAAIMASAVMAAGCSGLLPQNSAKVCAPETVSRFSERDIEKFVYDWFALLDSNADISALDDFLPQDGFRIIFPDRIITSWRGFEAWYAEDLRKYKRITHEIEEIKVSLDAPCEYSADFVLFWQGVRFDGWVQSSRVRESWKIADTGSGLPQIISYVLEEVK